MRPRRLSYPDAVGLFMDVAILDYGWLLNDAQQRIVLQLPLAAYNTDRTSWEALWQTYAGSEVTWSA